MEKCLLRQNTFLKTEHFQLRTRILSEQIYNKVIVYFPLVGEGGEAEYLEVGTSGHQEAQDLPRVYGAPDLEGLEAWHRDNLRSLQLLAEVLGVGGDLVHVELQHGEGGAVALDGGQCRHGDGDHLVQTQPRQIGPVQPEMNEG